MDSTVGGLDELAEKIRQYKLKQILGVDDFSILIWKHPQKTRPREASYIILKYRDDYVNTPPETVPLDRTNGAPRPLKWCVVTASMVH